MAAQKKKARYAVVGLGHIAQVAALPGFRNAKNAEIAALVSGDPTKHEELSNEYKVDRCYKYEEYDQCLESGEVDAVYIALPNHMHCDFAVRAAQRGVHVLCEKPMAVTEDECRQMIDAAGERDVKLMIAYRLHFEEANLNTIEIAHSGQIGNPRVFNSTFNMYVDEDDIRIDREKGGGAVYDIGIYCINAARYLFRDEPTEVTAFAAADRSDPRFQEVEESLSGVLRFPGERLSAFTCSFGAADVSTYRIVGTEGDVRLDLAYSYSKAIEQYLTIDGKTTKKKFRKRDQFGPQIAYFADCILNDHQPEPSGEEGLADVRIIRALYESAKTGRSVRLEDFHRAARPSLEQEIHMPAVKEPEPVHADSPHAD